MQSYADFISLIDIFLVPLFLFLVIGIAFIIKKRHITKYPEYHYFVKGLVFKIIGVILFSLVYLFYYNGGDTTNYFLGSKALVNLLLYDFEKGYAILFNLDSYHNNLSSFNVETGYPPSYMFYGNLTFNVCRFSSIFTLLGCKSYFVTSLLVTTFSYIGVWKIYRLFNSLYPSNMKVFAYLILFLPTLIFWGGGIMKDSYVLCSTCWISYNFYMIFIIRKKYFLILFLLFLIL